jgi:hypothetical protein
MTSTLASLEGSAGLHCASLRQRLRDRTAGSSYQVWIYAQLDALDKALSKEAK